MAATAWRVLLLCSLAFCQTSLAYPEGAPWGAANPATAEDCANCHFGSDPVFDSPALSVTGLPARLAPGSYEFLIEFASTDAVVAGFQAFASKADGDAGQMVAASDDIEALGAAVRSIDPAAVDGQVTWSATWRIPEVFELPVVLYVAASAANDDGSPLGDVIHYRQYVWAVDETSDQPADSSHNSKRPSGDP